MKNYILHTMLCLLLLTGTYAGSWAQGDPATVSGKVTDATNDDPLPGAAVYIEETAQGASTDLTGRYSIRNVKPGKITLVVSFIGYENERIEREAGAGEELVVNVKLRPAVTSLDQVTVKANLEGQQKALNQQLTADNIKNVVSADLISRFPDLNVAEALQRVPGVNITRNRGEGSTISIRGTPKHFTNININGEQIPSTQDDGSRNESLDLIPADQLASMEITKAITPDMDGDAIGGSVNLRTPTARGNKLRLKAEAGAGYNSLSERYNGIGRLRLDRRFFATDALPDGRFGVLIGFSYFGTDNEEDSYQAAWSPFGNTPIQNLGRDSVVIENYEYRDLINRRQRYGATATLDYQFSPTSGIVFNFMYNRRQDADQRNRIRGALNQSAGVQWTSLDTIRGVELRRDLSLADYYSENFSYNLQGNHQVGSLKVDWGAFYAPSRRISEGLGGRFERGADNRLDLVTTTPAGIYTDLPQYEALGTEVNFYDPFVIPEVNRYETNDLNFSRRLQFLRPGDPYYEEFPGFSFRQTQNGRTATVYGLEINTQVPFTFLPGFLSAFGSYFNYTFTESDAFTEDRSGISLPGQARHTLNAALTFDYKNLSARVSLNHNGSFLDGVAGEARNDIVQAQRTQIDANASWRIGKHLRLFAEFMNVTNAPSIRYQGIRERVAYYAYFGWWNRFGVSFTL